MKHQTNDYVIRIVTSPKEIDAKAWNQLLHQQPLATPFMRHEYLLALHTSQSATPSSGWTPKFFLLQRGAALVGACAVYLKSHSYGEYVFDQAWANAYHQHGLNYYPKAVGAVPFTPVPGTRLMALTEADRVALAKHLIQWCKDEQLSSLHLLFTGVLDQSACEQAGMLSRHAVQFHWNNAHPPYRNFEQFLESLVYEKRKKIRQERRKVATAGVRFRTLQGAQISPEDWDFFYRCYERNYLEHGNSPYLSRNFFDRMAATMSENWLLFVAEREGRPIAASLIALNSPSSTTGAPVTPKPVEAVAYGRYWGALERVDCLHFEACYYQPIQWCIDRGYQRFEGGAQGEHKMARALMPVRTDSAHWLAQPAFFDAVQRYLEREDAGMADYLRHLAQRSPFRPHPEN